MSSVPAEINQGLAIRMQDLSPEYAEIMVLGGVLQKSGYFKDVRDQAQAVTKILFGRELGFSPIISMGGIHIIEGKLALSSNLMATLIKRSGKYDYRVKTWTVTECVLSFRERDIVAATMGPWEDVGESSFTMDDAKAAGVLRAGGSWSKYPKAMLFARALSQGLRTYCPDVSAAPIYNPEEMGATVNEEGEVTELPASAKAVAAPKRTTEEIPIRSVAAVSATAKLPSEPSPSITQVKGEQGEAPQAESREPGDDSDEDATIDLPRQRALHRAFKDAIRNPEAQKKAEVWLRDWLKNAGYTDADGKGTTKTIPLVLFEEVKDNAVRYAAQMPV